MRMNRNRQMRVCVFLIDDESESRNEGAYLRFTMNRNRQMRGRVYDTGGTGIARRRVCLRYMIYDASEEV